MLLGPIKLIPGFAGATRGKDASFKRSAALWSTMIAVLVLAFLIFLGGMFVDKYRLSIDSIRIAGGLVLLLSAILSIFAKPSPPAELPENVKPLTLAASPIVSPVMIPAAGVAAVLIFMLLAKEIPGMELAVIVAAGVIITMNFVVMYFNEKILAIPGLMLVLQLLGAVLIFMQTALAIDTIIDGIRHLRSV